MTFTMLSTLVLLSVVAHGAYGSHFRGGAMSWKAKNNGQQIELTYRVGFKYDHSEYRFQPCTPEAQESQTLLQTGGYLTCDLCTADEARKNFDWICVDYNIEDDWAVGGHVVTYNVPPGETQFEIKYENCCWLKVKSPDTQSGARGWNLATSINVAARPDGIINSSPVSALIPLEKFYRGCTYNLKITVTDPDNDIVQCRNMKTKECPDPAKGWSRACGAPTSGLTVNRDCTLVFNTEGVEKGQHAVNILIKDCPDMKCKVPYSKVPLLFLLEVGDDSATCMKPSVIISPECKTVRPGEYFEMDVMADAGDPTKPISKIISQKSVSDMEVSTMRSVPGTPDRKAVTFSWRPTEKHLGDNFACFSAHDSEGYTSGSSCANIRVTNAPILQILPEESTPGPNGELIAGKPWVIKFNTAIMRPPQTANIYLIDEDGTIVLSMDAATSEEVTFTDTSIEFYPPDMTFPLFPGESASYRLSLDNGVAMPVDGGCSAVESQWNVNVIGKAFEANNCQSMATRLGLNQPTCDGLIGGLPDADRVCCKCYDTLYGAGPPAPPGALGRR